MYTESQLNPQFLAKHHGNRQHYMTASRTPPSHREDSHENLRSPLGSCNAHATTLAEPSSMRWAATTQEDLRCRRAAPRRPSGAATALVSAQTSLAGIGNLVGFDQTVEAMYKVGRSLPFELRESALGGLAATPDACAWCESHMCGK